MRLAQPSVIECLGDKVNIQGKMQPSDHRLCEKVGWFDTDSNMANIFHQETAREHSGPIAATCGRGNIYEYRFQVLYCADDPCWRNSQVPLDLGEKLEQAVHMALNEVVAILGFSLNPDDRAFGAILKSKTMILNSVLNAQVRIDETRFSRLRKTGLREFWPPPRARYLIWRRHTGANAPYSYIGEEPSDVRSNGRCSLSERMTSRLYAAGSRAKYSSQSSMVTTDPPVIQSITRTFPAMASIAA